MIDIAKMGLSAVGGALVGGAIAVGLAYMIIRIAERRGWL